MLIRSQKEGLLFSIEKTALLADDDGSVYCYFGSKKFWIGKYSTKRKATKVLNMIQEWYVDAVLTKGISGDMLRVFTKAEPSNLNMMIAEKVTSESLKRMCFQMPEDSEVKRLWKTDICAKQRDLMMANGLKGIM